MNMKATGEKQAGKTGIYADHTVEGFKDMSEASLKEVWEKLLYDRFKDEMEQACSRGKKTLELDMEKLELISPGLVEFITEKPDSAIKAAEEALGDIRDTLSFDRVSLKNIRFTNAPGWMEKEIRDLRSSDLGNLVSLNGLVKKATEVRPRVQSAYYECLKCGCMIRVKQNGQKLSEPRECPEEQGGCGRKSSFRLITEGSKFIDAQYIQIQEKMEGKARGAGANPRKIKIYLEDDLVEQVYPGDVVNVVGVVRGEQRRTKGGKSTEFSIMLDANSLASEEKAFEDIELTEDDKKEIKKLAEEPDIYSKLKNSIAPTIYGMENEKNAIILQLFGGVPKIMPDGTHIRGDIHILLCGDPGTAKTQILKGAERLSPRSMFASGKGSSAAGLTASAVRDTEFGEGQFTLEAGALVLADLGLAAIDELDKMDSKDRDALHGAMEQQEISISKAGINATLKTRCALLAAANPKFQRFDQFGDIAEQINLPPALFSRFDLIFPIQDRVEKERDTELSSHIIKAHTAGERHQREAKTEMGTGGRKRGGDGNGNGDKNKEAGNTLEPPIQMETFRKYVAYAKRNVYPELTEKASERIQSFYVDTRKKGKDKDVVPLTPRQIEAVIRLSEASARVRLSDRVEEKDAERAIELTKAFLEEVSFDEEAGIFDVDMISGDGISHSQQRAMRDLIDIIRDLTGDGREPVPEDEVIEQAVEEGRDEKDVKETLKKMSRDGQITYPRLGKVLPID